MAGFLIDTCIIIDHLRAHQPARQFMSSLRERPALSAMSVAELWVGGGSIRRDAVIAELIDLCRIVPIDGAIAEAGGQYRRRYGPSHGVELADALIAATAEIHGLRLATRNRKHFPMLTDVLVPY